MDQPKPSSSRSHGSKGRVRVVQATGVLADATRLIRRVLIVAAVVGGLGIVARIAYGPGKSWWGRRQARASEVLWNAGDLAGSGQRLKLALQFGPRDPEVLRWAARYCARGGLQQGLMYYEMLLGDRVATRADHVEYAELALALNRIDLAGVEIGRLLAAEPKALDLLHLLVRQQRAARDIPAAIRTARYALLLSPADTHSQWVLGSLLLGKKTDPAAMGEGRRLLLGLVVANAANAGQAVSSLAAAGGLGRGEMEVLLKWLSAHPPVSMLDRLLAVDLRLMLNPGQSNSLVAETVRSLGPELMTTNLPAVINWASARGGSPVLLESLPMSVAVTNRAVLELRAVVLANLKEWDDLEALMTTSESRFERFLIESLRGRVAVARGRRAEAQPHFEAAIEAPGVRVFQLRTFARELEAVGEPVMAARSLRRAMALASKSGDSSVALNSGIEVLRLLGSTDESEMIRDTLRQMNDALPGDDAIAGERAWYDLLFKEPGTKAGDIGRRLHARHPEEVQWRFLAALGELEAGKAMEALQVIEEQPVTWSQLRPRWKAVYVAALGAGGRREAARRFALQLPDDSLKSIERRLVSPWR